MPRITPFEELESIFKEIGTDAQGVRLDAISSALGGILPLRTLQRRLARLEEQGRIVRQRVGRSVVYRTAPATMQVDAVLPMPTVEMHGETYVPISTLGQEIKQYVRQPLQGRRPVGYDIAFLEAYHPNETSYLPQALRDQLHALGRSPAEQAPAGTFARDILHRLLIDLSWASSQLEGNTYSRLDTERLIDFGQAAEGKDALETQMILNHKAAIEYVVHGIDSVGIDTGTVIALHALLLDGLLADPMACGRLRRRTVEIGGSVYRPIGLPQRVEELFGLVLGIGARIDDPFEQAFFLMVHLPYLQPFEDVNKRVSRLAANIPLIKRNLCPLSFLDVPTRTYVDALLGVYELIRIELLRDVFVWAYERSCQQYVAVRSQMVPPDTFRLRHRVALAEAVRAIIRNDAQVDEENIRRVIPKAVTTEDAARFIHLVQEEFKALHPGNAVRFGLRPLDYEAWNRAHPR